MKSTLLALAVLTTPIQASELKDCRQVASEFIDEQASFGLLPNGVKSFPDAVLISFISKDKLYMVTMLVTNAPEGYSPKKGAKLVSEGYCDLKGEKAYWGVSSMSDKRSRASR